MVSKALNNFRISTWFRGQGISGRLIVLSAVVVSVSIFLALQKGILGEIGVSFISLLTGASVGVLLGFLFSVPRILSSSKVASNDTSDIEQSARREVRANLLQTNSNLEKISDWLTTMIVGVALINASEIFNFFSTFSSYLERYSSSSVGKYDSFLPIVGTLLLIVGFTLGFLSMYLVTRLKLAVIMAGEEKKLREGLPQSTADHVLQVAQGLRSDSDITAIIASGIIYPDEAINIMDRFLYEDGGYVKAIEISDYLLKTAAIDKPRFWFYRAAAFGQKYSALLQDGDEKEREGSRNNALQAARRSVILDSRYKRELSRIADPDGKDDDLKDLKDDPDFISIVNGLGSR